LFTVQTSVNAFRELLEGSATNASKYEHQYSYLKSSEHLTIVLNLTIQKSQTTQNITKSPECTTLTSQLIVINDDVTKSSFVFSVSREKFFMDAVLYASILLYFHWDF